MAAEALLFRTPSGSLAPADDESRALIETLKIGAPVRAKLARARNLQFHRKVFALFKLAFDSWEPGDTKEYKGRHVEKNFDRFRKDLLILAGFYKATYNIKGDVRLEAESISFASMSEDRFQQVFKAVLNVVWKHVLQQAGYKSEADVERVVEELLRFE